MPGLQSRQTNRSITNMAYRHHYYHIIIITAIVIFVTGYSSASPNTSITSIIIITAIIKQAHSRPCAMRPAPTHTRLGVSFFLWNCGILTHRKGSNKKKKKIGELPQKQLHVYPGFREAHKLGVLEYVKIVHGQQKESFKWVRILFKCFFSFPS